MTRPILEIRGLEKTYEGGFTALHSVVLDIHEGEIFALLGPNGAGKTTLIGTVCGLVQPSGGTVRVGGHDTATDYRAARSLVGLVPQEVNLEPFEKVINTVRFSRGLFGKPRDEALIEAVLRQLSLWDKRDTPDPGAVRRHEAARSDRQGAGHEPRVLFLDEPTAGVDVELRRDMWEVVRRAEGRAASRSS
jgi:ABC-2 type transport system ATP-binding protein